MVPSVVGVPSPQSMIAVKSSTVEVGLASVNLATTALFRSTPVFGVSATGGLAVSGASAITALAWATVVAPPSSVIGDRDLVAPLLGIGVGRGDARRGHRWPSPLT